MHTIQFKLLVVIIIILTFPGSGQKNPSTPSPSSPPEDALALGIDVSQFQGKIDWNQVKQNETKIAFVFVKATESTEFVDPLFPENWQGAKQAGIIRGAYHFFDAKQDAKTQAELFIKTVKKLEKNDLPPWLDLESGKFDEVDEVARKNFINSVFLWLDTVENGLGAIPIIYTSPDFARDYLTDKRFSRYALAAAEYDTDSTAPHLAGAWAGKTWTFWQYSERGTITGINGTVDLDRYNGSHEELMKFAKK